MKKIMIGMLALILAAGAAPAGDDAAKPPKQKMLFEIFSPIMHDIGTFNTQRAEILSGPIPIKVNKFVHGKGMTPATARQWNVRLGQSSFKITIDDEAQNWTIADSISRVEQIPAVYRRCLEVISEEGKTGLTFYKGLGGAHGGQDYINVEPGARALCMVHEAGHCLEQRARNTETNILVQWQEAIKQDKIEVSGYGNQNHWEDLAEFAQLYAHCIDHAAGRGMKGQLQKLSPNRFRLWEHILVLTKAMPADQAKTKPDFDFEGEYKKLLERDEKMKPILAEVNENIKAALELKEVKK